ncbi:hypothetical protein [Flavobacterium flavigenum]|uniref:hypothetical protein n=1 Tax=Flavobacterium flavigenum TaxID=3003258 RepID=UPI0022AC07B5|nr:hypothetical protein [Flavobacterium flavigenum]
MNENQDQNFVKVNYNLLASPKLNSTQKLFLSYIIGWQNNNKICFETNRNLALRFGKKYGGIRSVIKDLNTFDFFKSKSKDYDETTRTSGHEITVNIDKLEKFLSTEKPIVEPTSTEEQSNNEDNSNLPEAGKIDECEFEQFPTYDLDDIVDLTKILKILDFNESDINQFIQHFQTQQVTFDSFTDYFISLKIENKTKGYKGIIISNTQAEQLEKMFSKD